MAEDPLLRYLHRRTTRRFVALVRARRDEVLNTAYRVLGDRDLAEDVTQEVFLKLLTARWEPGKIRSGRALLAAHTVRTALTRIRSDARRSLRERKTVEGAAADSSGAPLDQLLDVRDAVLKLPSDLRGCVELRYFGGLTLEEVSAALELGITTVKERLREAREILKTSLAPLAAVLLGALFSESADSVLPRVSMSGQLREKLEELAKQGPSAAVAVAGTTPFWSAKLLLPLAACGVLLGGAGIVAFRLRSTPEAPMENATRVAAAPVVTTPTVAVAVPLQPAEKVLQEPVTPPRLAKPYRVEDKEGQPIEGVQVTLVHWLNGPKPEWAPPVGEVVQAHRMPYWLISSETDAWGGFEFADAAFQLDDLGARVDATWFVARKEGFLDSRKLLTAQPLDGFSLTMERSSQATVRVVMETSGKPVRSYRLEYGGASSEGMRNNLGPLSGPIQEVTVDDADGSFRFTPTDADWMGQVKVTLKDGTILSGKQFVTEESSTNLELVLRVSSASRIFGVVEDASGTPVAGAEVYACNYLQPLEVLAPDYKPQRAERRGAHKVASAADGTFVIDPIPNETWLVALSGNVVPAIVKVPHPASEEPIHLVIGRGGSVRIERLESGDATVKGEQETLLLIGLEKDPPQDTGMIDPSSLPFGAGSTGFRMKTDATGVALFEGLPRGHYYWRQGKTRFEVQVGEVKVLVDRDPLPVPVAPSQHGARVHGRITIAGKPLAGQIIIAEQHAPLDADGRYETPGVLPGVHFLQPPINYPGLPNICKTIRFEVSPDDKDLDMSWDFPLCEVKGRVFLSGDPQNAPQLSLTIWLKWADDTQPRLAAPFKAVDLHCDAAGSFAHKYLTSGEYFLVGRAKGFEMQVREFEVSKESAATQELDLRLAESRAAFTLKLVDAVSGSAVAPVSFSFTRRGGALQIYPDSFSFPGQMDDHFEWLGLPPGVYEYGVAGNASQGFGFVYGSVELKAGGGVVERKAIVPQAGDLVVTVEDAAGRRFEEPMPSIELRRPDGQPAAIPLFIYLDTDPKLYKVACNPSGSFRFPGLPIGMYTIAVSRTGFQPFTESVEVRHGQTAQLGVTISRQ